MFYHLWTEGCQMNVSDSRRVAGALEALGYIPSARPEEADVIVLNTCVVRQSAEDKACGRLTSLRPLKQRNPDLVINLMGCLVGRREPDGLRRRFPFVDVFSPPSDPRPLIRFLLRERPVHASGETIAALQSAVSEDSSPGLARFPFLAPADSSLPPATALVPIVLGCSHACTYCVIPYRRGGEQSRPEADILDEIRMWVARGAREVTLLGQIVDRYGKDTGGTDLPALLRKVNAVGGLERIRFLTSHPTWMTDDLIETAAQLTKVCEHIEVPVQAGDDEVLARMKRGYSAEDYRRLIGRIREKIPGASIATDVIVGFPGETEEHFQHTYDLLAELRLDVAHLARYSPRPDTFSARNLPDDVAPEEKKRRFRLLEELQERIAVGKNAALLGKTLEILVEGKHKGRWFGRTRTNRLVFFDDPLRDWNARLLQVEITHTSAWSLQGDINRQG
ncbi:MAG: tRNA (N6-isopentenyl adenosine(37)-C2)-methylthiotransferase MiaB [Anaerolineales bacterium]|nr:tRNA (N6-isopentenyl adenosine(37)-C2)-methylthiotransferase MiaB [Anaerolineales bacterium]